MKAKNCHLTDLILHTSNPSIREVETGKSVQVQDLLVLQSSRSVRVA